uniref:Uncharacterized protein n=1 Tax=Chromera velia CCMP2878 TaxID=1169474 RepID=A0A0G4GCA8_9ALVE|eukprot:Cvel_4503.t1-p1 / transcript=Cvel_4503.t1 / gene=Cvel_4503 / organism=Chromera_velia_CCMP2878 / gene_product=hypothetical protein / transcript_product=hypothetical protein / location=Cvel_scaffold197:17086-25279(-) / protein_length=2038 / sequence_SO=supercontig / SO=protein_coding / is_pseudo=false
MTEDPEGVGVSLEESAAGSECGLSDDVLFEDFLNWSCKEMPPSPSPALSPHNPPLSVRPLRASGEELQAHRRALGLSPIAEEAGKVVSLLELAQKLSILRDAPQPKGGVPSSPSNKENVGSQPDVTIVATEETLSSLFLLPFSETEASFSAFRVGGSLILTEDSSSSPSPSPQIPKKQPGGNKGAARGSSPRLAPTAEETEDKGVVSVSDHDAAGVQLDIRCMRCAISGAPEGDGDSNSALKGSKQSLQASPASAPSRLTPDSHGHLFPSMPPLQFSSGRLSGVAEEEKDEEGDGDTETGAFPSPHRPLHFRSAVEWRAFSDIHLCVVDALGGAPGSCEVLPPSYHPPTTAAAARAAALCGPPLSPGEGVQSRALVPMPSQHARVGRGEGGSVDLSSLFGQMFGGTGGGGEGSLVSQVSGSASWLAQAPASPSSISAGGRERVLFVRESLEEVLHRSVGAGGRLGSLSLDLSFGLPSDAACVRLWLRCCLNAVAAVLVCFHEAGRPLRWQALRAVDLPHLASVARRVRDGQRALCDGGIGGSRSTEGGGDGEEKSKESEMGETQQADTEAVRLFVKSLLRILADFSHSPPQSPSSAACTSLSLYRPSGSRFVEIARSNLAKRRNSLLGSDRGGEGEWAEEDKKHRESVRLFFGGERAGDQQRFVDRKDRSPYQKDAASEEEEVSLSLPDFRQKKGKKRDEVAEESVDTTQGNQTSQKQPLEKEEDQKAPEEEGEKEREKDAAMGLLCFHTAQRLAVSLSASALPSDRLLSGYRHLQDLFKTAINHMEPVVVAHPHTERNAHPRTETETDTDDQGEEETGHQQQQQVVLSPKEDLENLVVGAGGREREVCACADACKGSLEIPGVELAALMLAVHEGAAKACIGTAEQESRRVQTEEEGEGCNDARAASEFLKSLSHIHRALHWFDVFVSMSHSLSVSSSVSEERKERFAQERRECKQRLLSSALLCHLKLAAHFLHSSLVLPGACLKHLAIASRFMRLTMPISTSTTSAPHAESGLSGPSSSFDEADRLRMAASLCRSIADGFAAVGEGLPDRPAPPPPASGVTEETHLDRLRRQFEEGTDSQQGESEKKSRLGEIQVGPCGMRFSPLGLGEEAPGDYRGDAAVWLSLNAAKAVPSDKETAFSLAVAFCLRCLRLADAAERQSPPPTMKVGGGVGEGTGILLMTRAARLRLAEVYDSLRALYTRTGRLTKALIHCNQGIELFEAVQDGANVARLQLALCRLKLQDFRGDAAVEGRGGDDKGACVQGLLGVSAPLAPLSSQQIGIAIECVPSLEAARVRLEGTLGALMGPSWIQSLDQHLEEMEGEEGKETKKGGARTEREVLRLYVELRRFLSRLRIRLARTLLKEVPDVLPPSSSSSRGKVTWEKKGAAQKDGLASCGLSLLLGERGDGNLPFGIAEGMQRVVREGVSGACASLKKSKNAERALEEAENHLRKAVEGPSGAVGDALGCVCRVLLGVMQMRAFLVLSSGAAAAAEKGELTGGRGKGAGRNAGGATQLRDKASLCLRSAHLFLTSALAAFQRCALSFRGKDPSGPELKNRISLSGVHPLDGPSLLSFGISACALGAACSFVLSGLPSGPSSAGRGQGQGGSQQSSSLGKVVAPLRPLVKSLCVPLEGGGGEGQSAEWKEGRTPVQEGKVGGKAAMNELKDLGEASENAGALVQSGSLTYLQGHRHASPLFVLCCLSMCRPLLFLSQQQTGREKEKETGAVGTVEAPSPSDVLPAKASSDTSTKEQRNGEAGKGEGAEKENEGSRSASLKSPSPSSSSPRPPAAAALPMGPAEQEGEGGVSSLSRCIAEEALQLLAALLVEERKREVAAVSSKDSRNRVEEREKGRSMGELEGGQGAARDEKAGMGSMQRDDSGASSVSVPCSAVSLMLRTYLRRLLHLSEGPGLAVRRPSMPLQGEVGNAGVLKESAGAPENDQGNKDIGSDSFCRLLSILDVLRDMQKSLVEGEERPGSEAGAGLAISRTTRSGRAYLNPSLPANQAVNQWFQEFFEGGEEEMADNQQLQQQIANLQQ